MDTRRLYRSPTLSTMSSDVSAAGFFAEQPVPGINERSTARRSRWTRRWKHTPEVVDEYAEDAEPIDPSLSSVDSKGTPDKRRPTHYRQRSRGDHIPATSRRPSEAPTEPDNDWSSMKHSKKKVPPFRRLLMESEINEFLNSKVHDDPFARSSLPYALRFRGSIFWNLLPQLVIVASWGTLIVCISMLKTKIGVSSILITALGFVVGLALSFRVNTAYERYNEGRKYWAQLAATTRNLSRYVWFQLPLRKGHEKQDTLMKVTVLKLLIGFAIALKHHLREELGTDYDDLRPFVAYLPTYAKKRAELAALEARRKKEEMEQMELEGDKLATAAEVRSSSPLASPPLPEPEPLGRVQTAASGLGLQRRSTFQQRAAQASSDIRSKLMQQWFPMNPKLSEYLIDRDDRISRATVMHGNLPLEILEFIAYYARELQHEHKLLNPSEVAFFYTQSAQLTDILTGTERILRTPLPLAYNILCNQLAWIFVLILPFQLVSTLEWVAIPGTIIAGYVILGLAAIGLEIENPFGFDSNDLDLNRYCQSISVEVAMVMSQVPYADSVAWMKDRLNRPLAPVYSGDYETCMEDLDLEDVFGILQQTVEDPSKRWHAKHKQRKSGESDRDAITPVALTSPAAEKSEGGRPHRPSISSSLKSEASRNESLTSPEQEKRQIPALRRPAHEIRPQSVILEDVGEEDEKSPIVLVKSATGSTARQAEDDGDEGETLEDVEKHLPRLAPTVSTMAGLPVDEEPDEVRRNSSNSDRNSLAPEPAESSALELTATDSEQQQRSYDLENEADAKEIYELASASKYL